MFFIFTEYDDENVLPEFQFLGRYSIDVLPSILGTGSTDTFRLSGLQLGLEVKDKSKLTILFRALYFFMRNDMIGRSYSNRSGLLHKR